MHTVYLRMCYNKFKNILNYNNNYKNAMNNLILFFKKSLCFVFKFYLFLFMNDLFIVFLFKSINLVVVKNIQTENYKSNICVLYLILYETYKQIKLLLIIN